ncbi:hypothetical protein [Pseudoalteromonas luteoviolacea]|uniref:Uncharacterized protein n=1 Tax=Pseudoalteromonas luteoviolacea (strain 2ta16) TaxID=1353533 RepID=V4J5M3_PSEL2|nr:hypothetical protein [Pseudoalteromonas luteoviolacea]ESP90647.1 hypothetical protein PL2TA16_01751 [Pseudoalteromonas luteoviolacea 2ta16]KZN41777.1 hypothetical protein N483_13990 [Pseudoalteromonas luteoviolacea NCIMB 1944]
MPSLSHKLKELLKSNEITAYIIVANGGGTGNEASAARLGRYLNQELSMQVKFLTFDPSQDKFGRRTDLSKECNEDSIAKLKKLNVPSEQIVNTEEKLVTKQRFFVFCAADIKRDNCREMGLAIKSINAQNNKQLNADLFLGSVNLNPFAWHSDQRGIFDSLGKEIERLKPLPLLADYLAPSSTLNPLQSQREGLSSGNKHKLVDLLQPSLLNCQLMTTYGLHALFESDPCDYRWVARAFTGLVKGLHQYVSNQKKSVVLLALHPRNTSDFTILRQHCEENIIWYNGTENSARSVEGCSKIHLLSSTATHLNEVVNDIAKLRVKQVIVIQKHESDIVPPDSFKELLRAATVPTLTEGANTVGQLIQMQKPFWTLAEAEKQLPLVSEELQSLEHWQSLLTAVFNLPALSRDKLYLVEKLKKATKEIEQAAINARKISKEFRHEMMVADIQEENLNKIANHTENSIDNKAVDEYLSYIGDLHFIFDKECKNQVLLALTAWYAKKHGITPSIHRDTGKTGDPALDAIVDILSDAHITDLGTIKAVQNAYQENKPYTSKKVMYNQLSSLTFGHISTRLLNELVDYLYENFH